MLLIKKIKKYQADCDVFAILAILFFLLLSLFIPSVKLFFLLAFALSAFLILQVGFPKAIIYLSPILGNFSVGQSHQILVVPAKAIISQQYWEGQHLVVSITPYLIISAVALLLIPIWQKKFPKKKLLAKNEKWLIILFGSAILSAIYTSLMIEISLLSVLSQLGAIAWIYYFTQSLKNDNKKGNKKLLNSLFLIISSLVIFESLIVLGQIIVQSNLGLLIENTQFAPSFGLGADEQSTAFRPFGFHSHPNGLANHQLLTALSISLIFCYQQSLKIKNKTLNTKKFLMLIIVLALINIILSLSRAAYLALALVLIFLYLRQKKEIKRLSQKISKFIKKISPKNKLIFLLIAALLIFNLADRLLNSIYAFDEGGGLNSRFLQYNEAIEVFKKSPVFGIGDRMFIPTSYQLFPKGVMTKFPENVHQGFLLFAIERGLLGVIAYGTFLTLTLRKIKNAPLNKLTQSVIYSGLISGFTIMLFHPERNLLSYFMLLVIAITSSQNYEEKLSTKN